MSKTSVRSSVTDETLEQFKEYGKKYLYCSHSNADLEFEALIEAKNYNPERYSDLYDAYALGYSEVFEAVKNELGTVAKSWNHIDRNFVLYTHDSNVYRIDCRCFDNAVKLDLVHTVFLPEFYRKLDKSVKLVIRITLASFQDSDTKRETLRKLGNPYSYINFMKNFDEIKIPGDLPESLACDSEALRNHAIAYVVHGVASSSEFLSKASARQLAEIEIMLGKYLQYLQPDFTILGVNVSEKRVCYVQKRNTIIRRIKKRIARFILPILHNHIQKAERCLKEVVEITS